jgi:parallel beta-helix repeat protein
MKNLLQPLLRAATVLCFAAALQPAFAINYHFSTTDGDDNRTAAQASQPATPWKSLAKLNAIFSGLKAGDTVFFKRGDVFTGNINVTASGSSSAPIVLTAYGAGAKPVISGFTTYTAWTSIGGNRWLTDAPGVERMNVVLVNGAFQAIGRWPNTTATNNGYVTIESHSGNSSVTSNALASNNWNGGEVVIRKNRWILDANKITGHSGGTINYTSESGYHASDGYGCFIQNHPNTLDAQGEWFHLAGKLGVYLTGNAASSTIQGSTVPVLVSASGQSNILFSDLGFTGANNYAFELRNTAGISIVNCTIANNGVNAIEASNCNALRIEGSDISRTGNIGLNVINCSGLVIRNNTINYSGAVAGMGKGGDGTYEAILLSGDNNLVEGNTIQNTGYIPVTFNGSSTTIKNNYITGFGLVKDDGGGIYTWNNSSNPPTYTARKITGNIIAGGKSASAGTNDGATKFSHGIYLDDNATNVEVSGNTVANNEGFGIYVHNARDNSITGNTAYNNTVQIALIHDDIAPNYPIRSTTISDNIFFALQPSQLTAEFKSRANDLADFGNFTNNRYARPFDDHATIGLLKNVNGAYSYQLTDVEGWQALYGKDAGSKSSPKTFSPYRINSLVSGNKFANGGFASNIGGLYSFASANNISTTWKTGELDGGSLAVNFSSLTTNGKGTVVIGIGALTAGRRYLLKFSLKGPAEQKMLDIYLRKSGAPYSDVTERKLAKVKASRTEVELLFTANETTSDGSIGIDVPEHSAPVYFDNIDLREATATDINVSDSIQFFVNPSALSTTTSVSGSWIDVNSIGYSGSFSLPAFASVVLLAGTATTVVTPHVTCSATGTILYERWAGVSGNDVAQIPLAQSPSTTGSLNVFEGVRDGAENYGSRIRGYICPPQTGNYTFNIAGDDGTELWLSTSDAPSTKIRIAYSASWTNFREWNRYGTQKSAAIYLEAGKKYYIEALHKEGSGGDHLSVAWTLPNGTMEAPIPGVRLSPFTPVTLQSQTISFAAIPDFVLGSSSSITLSATASSGLPVAYAIVSGTATLTGNVLTGMAVGTITIKASQGGNSQYAAAADVLQTITVVLPPTGVAQCSATGTILREQWNGVGGNDVAQIPVSTSPSSSTQLSSFEGPQNIAEAYGSRIRGYLCAPQTGYYTFYIAGDDATELWLSSNETPAAKSRIAYSLSWTAPRQWTKYASQKSAGIFLEAGKKYYVEALQKEGNGGDHLSVAWTLPNGTFEAPIPASRLSPFIPTTSSVACSATGTILREQWTGVSGNDVAQIPQTSTPNRTAQISKMELDQNVDDNYASRIRGYLCAPQTGTYTFYISGDDATELWLSTSDAPSAKIRIAYSTSWTNFREWTKFASQKSAAIYLEAGKKYYIEALHKEGAGGDHLSVAWTLPNGTMEAPIPGSRLSPFSTSNSDDDDDDDEDDDDDDNDRKMGGKPQTASSESAKTQTSSVEKSSEIVLEKTAPGIAVYPNPFTSTATVRISVAEAGPVSVDVLDVSGRLIQRLFSGVMKASTTQQWTLDAGKLAKGVYFVRITTTKGITTKKITKAV